LSDEYFNHSIATKGFCSIKRNDASKRNTSERTKAYWDSEAGALKKQRLVERNKTIQSARMLEKWKNPTNAMKNRVMQGRPSGAKDLSKRLPRCTIKRVGHNDELFKDAFEAGTVYNVHPVTIRRWSKLNINGWTYI